MTDDPDAGGGPAPVPDRAQAERTIMALLAQRAPGATICPSEAARRLAAGRSFRPLMGLIREAAAGLARRGEIEVTQGGRVVEMTEARGPIRLRSTSRGGSASDRHAG